MEATAILELYVLYYRLTLKPISLNSTRFFYPNIIYHHQSGVVMAKTRSMSRNQSYDVPWSDVNHDVLYLVMKRLEFLDFIAFSGVCKSWRSLALSNRNSFMASVPPMSMNISTQDNDKECCLEDFDGRKFKTILPHSTGRSCVGLTCGYLILFGKETNDFWLVNPVTRHEIYFPCAPHTREIVKAILVFSTSLSGWVFVMADRFTNDLWYSVAGKGAWNHVSTNYRVLDLHAFKGKIYILDACSLLFEMRLTLEPKLILLETEHFPELCLLPEFVSSGENLCLMQFLPRGGLFTVNELDIGKMKWVCSKETRKEYAFFHSDFKNIVAVKPESWADPRAQYEKYLDIDKRRKGRLINANMWYFPHDCLKVNVKYE